MRFRLGRRWLPLACVVLVLGAVACGPTPTPGAGVATATPLSAPEQHTATPTFTPTSTATRTPTPESSGTQPGPPSPTPSPTPTPMGLGPIAATPTPPSSVCEGLSGELEVQILVGPAEAVGLEPLAVGSAPWSVTSSQPPYLIQGGGSIVYDRTLQKEWGTYQVTLDLILTIGGACAAGEGDESLHMDVEMSGEQMVEVIAEGFHGEYPWAGTHTFALDFPIEEGATAEGEGWLFVLHLNGP